MSRVPAIHLAVLAVLIGTVLPAQASIRSYRSLSPEQKTALEQSERRLQAFDQALAKVERDYARRKIGAKDYAWYRHDLTAYISAEAAFQNDLLIKPRGMPEDQREVLETIARYSVLVPAYIAAIAAKAFASSGGSYSFTP
jgi:hypothetical protein